MTLVYDPDPTCPVCFGQDEECVCPPCPKCGEVGREECYVDLAAFKVPRPRDCGLELSLLQRLRRARAEAGELLFRYKEQMDVVRWLEELVAQEGLHHSERPGDPGAEGRAR